MHIFLPFFCAVCVCHSFSNLLSFSDFFPELSVFSVMKMKSDIVYARVQATILRSAGQSVKQIAKFFNKMEIGRTSGRKESASKTNHVVDRLF